MQQLQKEMPSSQLPLMMPAYNTSDDWWHMSLSRPDRRPDWSGSCSVQVWSIEDSWSRMRMGYRDTGYAHSCHLLLNSVKVCASSTYMDLLSLLKDCNKGRKGYWASCRGQTKAKRGKGLIWGSKDRIRQMMSARFCSTESDRTANISWTDVCSCSRRTGWKTHSEHWIYIQ